MSNAIHSHTASTNDPVGATPPGAANVPSEEGPIVAGRFVLHRHLATGRYGEIYRALDRTWSDARIGQHNYVALHMLDERFRTQTRLLHKLETSYREPYLWSHPNVLKIRAFGSDGGRYYLATELLEGELLRSLLDQASPDLMSRDEALGVLGSVGDALKYAHARGAVHGEICPETVFVTTERAIKVLDLLPASSPRSMPYFIEDAAPNGLLMPDPRDDVYGLAGLAYELLSGRAPYNGMSPMTALRANLRLAPVATLDPSAWQALARGLALRREERTASVGELLDELGVASRSAGRGPQAIGSNGSPATHVAPETCVADDMPVIGDFSGNFPELDAEPKGHVGAYVEFRAQQSARASASPEPRLLPSDIEAHRRLVANHSKPRTGAWAVSLVLIAALAAAAYGNYERLAASAAAVLTLAREQTPDTAAAREPQAALSLPPEASAASPGALAAPRAEPERAKPERAEPERAEPERAEPERAPAEPPPGIAEIPKDTLATPTLGNARSETVPSVAPEARASAADNVEDAATATTAATTAATAATAAPARFEFTISTVTVFENQATAAVAIRRSEGRGPASVAWWTTDGSAVAGDDYAEIERHTQTLDEDEHTIHIPIIGDAIAESREHFYVNLGHVNAESASVEAGRVEVVIVDDD